MKRSELIEKIKRSICLFFTAVFILTIAISTGNAFADDSSYTPAESAKIKMYYKALQGCLGTVAAYSRGGQLLPSNKTEFFDSAFDATVKGAMLEDELAGDYQDGEVKCGENNNALLREAITVLKIGSVDNLICDFEDPNNSAIYQPYNAQYSSCIAALNSGTHQLRRYYNDQNAMDYLKRLVEAKTGIHDLDTLTTAEQYVAYTTTFKIACVTKKATARLDDPDRYEHQAMIYNTATGEFVRGGFPGTSGNPWLWHTERRSCNDIAKALDEGGSLYTANKDYLIEQLSNGVSPDSLGVLTELSYGGTSAIDDELCYDNAGVLGWILCPVVSAASNLLSNVYESIENDFLQIDAINIFQRRNDGGIVGVDPVPDSTIPDESTLHIIWSAFRDIANIGFVIFLLIIILSQVTGWGIDNYGIKKMLPRLIVIAIIVNLSYFICEAAVDLSNIIGVSIKNVFNDFTTTITISSSAATGPSGAQSVIVMGSLFSIGIAALLRGGSGLILTLVAALISMAVAVLFLWIILIVRQAGLILAIGISPLAFLCYLFPNTEKLFKRWLDLVKGLLFLYPICAFIVSGGLMAGKIFAAMNADGTNPGLTLASMIVPVIPYLFIPSMLRNSLKAMGNLGARLQSIGSRWGHGLGGSASRAIGNSQGFKMRQDRINRNRTLRRARRIERRGGASTLTGAAMMRLRGGPTNAQRERLAAAMKANTDEEKRLRDIGNWSDATYVGNARRKAATADQIARDDTLSYTDAAARSEVNKANIDRQKRNDDITIYDPTRVDATQIRTNELRKAATERTNRLRDTLDYDQPMADAEVSQADMNRRIRRADTLQYNDADYVVHSETQAESARIAKQQRLDNYFDPNFAAGERHKSASAAHAELAENLSWDNDRERAENYAADETATTRRENALLNNDSIFRARQRRMNETQTEKKRIDTEAWTAERASGEVAKAKEEAYRAKVSANNYNDADYVKGVRNETKTMNQHQLEQTQNWAATDFTKSKAAQLQNARNAELRKMYTEQFSSMDKVRLGNASSGELIKALRATNTGDPQRATERIDAALSSLVNLGAEEEILESLRAFSTSDLRSMNANARTRLLQKAAASQSIALKGWGKAQLSAIQSNPSGATTVDFATYMAAPSTSGSNGSLSDFLRTNGNHALDGASKDLRKVISTYAPNAVSLDTLVNSSVSTKNGEELQYTNDTIRKRIVSASDGQKLAGVYTGQSLGNMDISTFKTIEARANALGVDVKTWFAPAIASLSGNQEGVAKVNNEIRKALGL